MFNIDDLKFCGEATINGKKLVAYDDVSYVHVFHAAFPDLDLEYRDFNDCCHNNPAIDEVDVLAAFAAAVSLKGVHRPGDCSWVDAADE